MITQLNQGVKTASFNPPAAIIRMDEVERAWPSLSSISTSCDVVTIPHTGCSSEPFDNAIATNNINKAKDTDCDIVTAMMSEK